MLETVRRIVTGHDPDGQSIFLMNGPTPTIIQGAGGTRIAELWETSSTPASNAGNAETTDHPFRLPPPPNGTCFRIVEFVPDAQRAVRLAASAPHDAAKEGYHRNPNARHPGFHTTATTDYAIVMSGEIYALVDEGEQLMKAGDILIQRGTSHSWSNRGSSNAYVAFILIDAEPVG